MEIDPDELKRRTEFLKAQRDKLLQLKQAERAKQLTEATCKQSAILLFVTLRDWIYQGILYWSHSAFCTFSLWPV